MIRLRKARIIARFEFISTIKRKSYLIATFGMPLFLLLYGGVVGGIGLMTGNAATEELVFGVIDESSVLAMTGPVSNQSREVPPRIKQMLEASGRANLLDPVSSWSGSNIFRPYPDESSARRALLEGEIEGYFWLHPDYLETGRVDSYTGEHFNFRGTSAERSLRQLVVERLLAGRVPDEIAARVDLPFSEVRNWTVQKDGEISQRSMTASVARLVVPIVFTMLLFVSLMMSAGYLVQGTALEKENKVIEVLLASANPDEILLGKLFGLGAAGLLQVMVWFSMVIATGVLFAAALAAFGIEIPWLGMVIGLFFFGAGYLFLGSLMLGAGSIGSNQKESQQLSAACSLLAVIPLMFMGLFIQDPHNTPGMIMTWIPFTAPVTVLLRLSLDPSGIAWWEIIGSFTLLTGFIWVGVQFGARLFRVGLLLSGARPKLREVIRQARLFD